MVTQPVSPLWSASGSPSSDSAYSTGSEAGHAPAPSNPIQLSPLRSQAHEALSCTIRVPNIRTIGHKPNYCHKRSYTKDTHKEHSTMWYEPPERLQRLDPAHTPYNAPPVPPHNHEEHFVESNQTESRVPVIHHENEQWTNVLHNDIHMTSNLTATNRTDPQEYLTAPNHVYPTNQNHPINHHQQHHHQTNHMVDANRQNDTVIDFQNNGMNRSNDFDGLTDRSLFQTSMLNIDEVLFGLS